VPLPHLEDAPGSTIESGQAAGDAATEAANASIAAG
jgi:hypothetical protein